MSVLSQGLIVIDAKLYNLTSDKCKDITIDAETDEDAGYHMAVQAMVGTIWWVMLWFVYVKNEGSLMNPDGVATIPITGMWVGIVDHHSGWTYLAYLSNFIVYLAVSVMEVVAFIFYIMGDVDWFAMYVTGPGYYGSVFLLLVPPIFATLQLVLPESMGGLNGDQTWENGYNAVFMMAIGLVVWWQAAMIHFLFAERVECYALANPTDKVKKVIRKCPLIQRPGQSDDAFEKACIAIMKATKESADAGRMALTEDALGEKAAAEVTFVQDPNASEMAPEVEEELMDKLDQGSAWI